jgi:hypothetical protein
VPDFVAKPGFMNVTTAYVGPRPVVDLHAGGLKVGEIAVRALRAGCNSDAAEKRVIAEGIGLALS